MSGEQNWPMPNFYSWHLHDWWPNSLGKKKKRQRAQQRVRVLPSCVHAHILRHQKSVNCADREGKLCFQWLSQTHWHFRASFSGLTSTAEGNNIFGIDNFSHPNDLATEFLHSEEICATLSLYQYIFISIYHIYIYMLQNILFAYGYSSSHLLPSFSLSGHSVNFQTFDSDPKSALFSGSCSTWKYALFLKEYSQVENKLKFLFSSLIWPVAANCRSKQFWESYFWFFCS